LRLADKVAIVTGAASGIGRSIAVLFAREGARLVVADVDEKGIEGTLSIIKRNGGIGLGIRTDVSDSAEVTSMVERAISQFARVDALVNNAGVEMKGSVASLGESDWDRVMNTNLKGVYLCSHFVIPHMVKRRQGVIINMASDLGISPIPNVAAYAATKGGIIALTKAMAKDHAKDGIRVNCLAPGPIETPLLRRFQPEEILKFVQEVMIPMGRLGTPEEVASAALFLASDEASFINGAIVTVNGGLVS
jgi:NAD(P)-dependent dehydrogenase (short-subunit alcohol dehydrogenase family)